MTLLQQANIDLAKSYLGQREIIENLGFTDKTFEAKMRSTGWVPPDAWCAALLKLIFMESAQAHDPAAISFIHRYFSLSAVETYKNCKASPQYHVTQTPQAGYAVIWEEGTTGKGHAGLVIAVTPTGFISIEGNTSDPLHPAHDANGRLITNPREGYIVAQHTHNYPSVNPAGLHVIGFISPDRIA